MFEPGLQTRHQLFVQLLTVVGLAGRCSARALLSGQELTDAHRQLIVKVRLELQIGARLLPLKRLDVRLLIVHRHRQLRDQALELGESARHAGDGGGVARRQLAARRRIARDLGDAGDRVSRAQFRVERARDGHINALGVLVKALG